MAYLVRRQPDRVEIRESRATPRGPRSRTLASFNGPLTPEIVDRAASRASRPFDADALVRRARAAGIVVASRSHEPEARNLLARLRRGDPMDPVMAGVLRGALEPVTTAPPPEALAEVSEWIGAGAAERGDALRDLLDAYGRIAASRPPRRTRPPEIFPRFSSTAEAR
jgi:hypothetical protein